MQDLDEAWVEFLKRAFPTGYAGITIKGIDLVLLDTYAAGCIESFVTRRQLDDTQINTLKEIIIDFEIVISELRDEAQDYFLSLKNLTEQALSCSGSPPSRE
jgi:hypothetical protein